MIYVYTYFNLIFMEVHLLLQSGPGSFVLLYSYILSLTYFNLFLKKYAAYIVKVGVWKLFSFSLSAYHTRAGGASQYSLFWLHCSSCCQRILVFNSELLRYIVHETIVCYNNTMRDSLKKEIFCKRAFLLKQWYIKVVKDQRFPKKGIVSTKHFFLLLRQ